MSERVVRRSNALRGSPWGREFRRTEVVPTGSGVRGAVAGGIGPVTAAPSAGPVRAVLRRLVSPDPGEGPTRAQIENGHFTVRVLGRGTATDGSFVAEAAFGADLDPGYGATARTLAESGLCLLRGETDTPSPAE